MCVCVCVGVCVCARAPGKSAPQMEGRRGSAQELPLAYYGGVCCFSAHLQPDCFDVAPWSKRGESPWRIAVDSPRVESITRWLIDTVCNHEVFFGGSGACVKGKRLLW